MDNNRIIAEWAGWKKRLRATTPPAQWDDDDFGVGDVAYWENPPPYDAGLTFWHGKNGLLAKISEKGKVFVNSFLHCYFDGLFGEGCWQWDFNPHSTDEGPVALLMIMDSDPAQLAEALAKMIKEEK